MNNLSTKEFVILLNLYRRFSLIIKPTPLRRHGKYDSKFIKIYFVALPLEFLLSVISFVQ